MQTLTNTINEYRELFLKSLMNDKKRWSSVRLGAGGYEWTEYRSPKYNNIQFVVGDVNFGNCVYIDGRVAFSIRVLPFTKIHKEIRCMKKYVKKAEKKVYNEFLKNNLNF